ncbi:DUF5719 family protein [Nocardioides sp. SYSU D00038]|uniref:DUF5719 family protein n=1 Tax=Nocardioides sp. SYSU D00038 TaxID=2812554 RepID=UPI0019678727|nr:DUF5719 family protein [Nocardioides sp. SYSU D00038]
MSGGRRATRARGGRFGLDGLLALLLPVACALALLAVRPADERPAAEESPDRVDLSSVTVACPAGGGAESRVAVTPLGAGLTGDLRGRVSVTTEEQAAAGAGDDLELASGRVASVPGGGGAVLVSADDDLAPALVAGRHAGAPVAATRCDVPRADQWFTGVGAGATHRSTIALVNPDQGPAVADVRLLAPAGPVDAPELRGVAVPGRSVRLLELAALVPRRGDLAAHVEVLRGQLSATVLDTADQLGRAGASSDWLAPQPAPATRSVLLGLTRGDGTRTLVLANPGDSEVRAELAVVTPKSTFAPEGVEEVTVAPGSTRVVALDALLGQAADTGAVGLVVDATGPVTASLRQVVDDDLSVLVPGQPLTQESAVVVPRARAARLHLAGAATPGSVTVAVHAADGTELTSTEVEVTPDTGANVKLPAGAALVAVTPAPGLTGLLASVLVVGEGAAVVGLVDLPRDARVPRVRLGLD